MQATHSLPTQTGPLDCVLIAPEDCYPPVQVRILMAEDNTTFASAVINLISMLPGVAVIGHAIDGYDALAKAELLKPDLVLLDIAMPQLNGLGVARRMQTWLAPPAIVFLSSHVTEAYRQEARALGVLGFVGKHDFVTELLPILEDMAISVPARKAFFATPTEQQLAGEHHEKQPARHQR